MAKPPICEEMSKDYRGYLLKALSNARQRAMHEHVKDCATCQVGLDVEQKQLSMLNVLPVEKVPTDLAEQILRRLPGEKIRIQKRQQRRFVVLTNAIATVTVLFILVVMIKSFTSPRHREASLRATTQNSMKQFGLIFKMFANESENERWPALVGGERKWVPDLALLYDEYLTDPQIMISSQHPDFKRLQLAMTDAWSSSPPDFEKLGDIMGESFAYPGFMVSNEEEFNTLLSARMLNEIPNDGTAFSATRDGKSIQPLREGVERFMITDINNAGASSHAQSTIPVLIEIATWKYKESVEDFKGTNVLYMDGHVAFVPLGTFPVLPSILDVLSGL